MADVVALQGAAFRDSRGHVGRTKFYYTFDPSVANNVKNARDASLAAITDIEAITNALIVGIDGLASQRFNPLDYGSTTDYSSAEDKAVLTFLVQPVSNPFNLNALMRLAIPAPNVGIFFADGETVNPAVASIATLITKLLATDASGGFFSNRQGFQPTSFVGGVRTRRKLQRKITLYTKDPGEIEPEE